MSGNTTLEKIKLLDQIFQVLSLDDMKQVASCDLVVSKLRGDAILTGPLLEMYQTNLRFDAEIMMLRAQIESTKMDFQVLLRCLSKGMGDSNTAGDFNNLKSRHGVY